MEEHIDLIKILVWRSWERFFWKSSNMDQTGRQKGKLARNESKWTLSCDREIKLRSVKKMRKGKQMLQCGGDESCWALHELKGATQRLLGPFQLFLPENSPINLLIQL